MYVICFQEEQSREEERQKKLEEQRKKMEAEQRVAATHFLSLFGEVSPYSICMYIQRDIMEVLFYSYTVVICG